MTTYVPRPIDTSEVALSSDLRELLERLARNNHDHWAQLRFAEGWRYGSLTNDGKKEHPDLVDYDDLPESKKNYDRKFVIETLKAVITLGYEIRRR